MKYIIFGSGESGRKALSFLGYERVSHFSSNNVPVTKEVEGKPILSYQKMLEIYDDKTYIIVVAAEQSCTDMIQQLLHDGITTSLAFRERDILGIHTVFPDYFIYGIRHELSYPQIMAGYHIEKYEKIVIWGGNRYLPYLLSEIMFQNPKGRKALIGVILPKGNYYNTLGVPIVRYEDVKDQMDCLVLNERCEDSSLPKEEERFLRENDRIIKMYAIDTLIGEYRHPELFRFKDIHTGKRCFIVATGPSVRIEDLDVLHRNREICLSVNKIYRCFDRTEWRPDYLGIADRRTVEDMEHDIPSLPGEIFICDNSYHKDGFSKFTSVNYFHTAFERYKDGVHWFSEDITEGVVWGKTITYDFAIQFAVYMGFKEIYLLGVDMNAAYSTSFEKGMHFIDDYWTEEEARKHRPSVLFEKDEDMRDFILSAYEQAKYYAETHGINIYNATRGGQLEVFERVDFDSLF